MVLRTSLMISSRACSMIRPGRLITEKRIAFILFATQDATENELLHGRVEIEGEDHDPPPCGILPEVPRRELPSCEVLFHDGMGLFALPHRS